MGLQRCHGGGYRVMGVSGQGWDTTVSWEQLGLNIKAQGRSWIRARASSEAAPHPILMLHFSPFLTALTNTPHILLPEMLEAGHPSNLTCSVPWNCKGSAPPIFSWTGTSVSFLSTNTTGSPVLTIIPQPQDHGTNLTCQVTLPGTGQVTTRITIRLNVSCEAGLRCLFF